MLEAQDRILYAQLLFFITIAGMIVPGFTYRNIAFGGGKEEIAKDEERIRTVRYFGKKISWLLK